MQSRSTAILFITLLCTLAALIAAGVAVIQRPDEAGGIRAALAWGRLAPLPESAQGIQVQIAGNEMTRSVRVTFHAPEGDVAQWIEASPGLREASTKPAGPFATLYEISPGEGAQHAEVTITELGNGNQQVDIYTYWS